MRKQILFILLLVPLLGISQQSFEQFTFNSQGDYYEGEEMSISWTIGDLVTESVTLDRSMLTQGFHQPILLRGNSPQFAIQEDLLNEDFNERSSDLESELLVSVYPNPTDGVFNVSVQGGNELFFVEILDVTGKKVLSKSSTTSISEIDLSSFDAGIYYLQILEKDQTIQFTSKVIKH